MLHLFHRAMTANVVNQDGSVMEVFSIRVPKGTAKRLADYKEQHGYSSRNQVINELLARGFVVSDFH